MKGLILLIQKTNLREQDIQQLIGKLFASPKYQIYNVIKAQIGRQIPIDALAESFKQIRSRINLDYYDEEYATNLVVSSISKSLLLELSRLKERSIDKGRMTKAKAVQDLQRVLTPENIEIYSVMRDELAKEQKQLEQEIALIDGILSYQHLRGVKP